ncbi:MAG: DUF4833 domain-containing protein [Bacteroidetes bacterium HGW-Bacteroidetes-12]|nr:MAG: DUF4833 domain-containing protein [Bacteroidetes bacterium HGW-Bacteroidetes-12]
MKIFYFLLLVFSISFYSFKNSASKSDGSSLFKIERSKDGNQIFYNAHTVSENKLDIENPITIFWIRKTEGGAIKPLTWIQQRYAYGLHYTKISETSAQFHFVSYDKRSFTLKKDKKDCFRVFTNLNNNEVLVEKIFIQIDGGSFWIPKISHVKLYTKEQATGKEMIEIIKP